MPLQCLHPSQLQRVVEACRHRSQKPGCTLVPAPVASDVCNVRRRTGGMDTAGVRAVRAVRLQGVGPALWVACQGRPQRQPTASFCAFRAGGPARVAGVGP